MLLLTCPHCGLSVEETELAPGGEAHIPRAGADADADAFEDYLFLRDNPKGPVLERWRHAFGCGKWFVAARDTATNQVFGTYPAQRSGPPEDVARRAGLEPRS